MLREFAQAALPHAPTTLVLPTGGFEASKHTSMLHAAKAELSEEAGLCGGTWHALLPEGHPGILEAKWCRNRFTPFLCIDPEVDTQPGRQDDEERIVSFTLTLKELRTVMAEGELLPPSLQTCVSALEWLRSAGKLSNVF
eukprot:CAMPEP_0174705598 /NCGR_PEP_ID=MMETSP1094-20130205/8771_1 /TAXON_ID=156173 /ORGANISM="Chrysochromulina brevifilum, Strain UTEX LB 985" /LENGTH=139 /DNA_ID=CAMNT_0015903793 /DNA_START=164 /DNA_END=583 /DNA_ORIENTATION=-